MANAPIRPSGAVVTDYIEITSPILSAQQATLSGTPVFPLKTLVDVIGGIAQQYTNDFIITGNIINWASMGLGTILSVGDVLRIQYFIL
jgi:hypothetical protein